MCGSKPCVSGCCCCGCSLRTGTLIIAIVYLILSVIAVIASVVNIATAKDDIEIQQDCYNKECRRNSGRNLHECIINCYNFARARQDLDKYGLAFLIADVLIYVIVLLGVFTNTPVLLLVFVYGIPASHFVHFVLSLALFIVHGVATWIIVLLVVFSFILFLIDMYYCIVVYSLYATLSNPQEYGAASGAGVVYGGPSPYYGAPYPQPGGGWYPRPYVMYGLDWYAPTGPTNYPYQPYPPARSQPDMAPPSPLQDPYATQSRLQPGFQQ